MVNPIWLNRPVGRLLKTSSVKAYEAMLELECALPLTSEEALLVVLAWVLESTLALKSALDEVSLMALTEMRKTLAS
jgi:hypothetical protein